LEHGKKEAFWRGEEMSIKSRIFAFLTITLFLFGVGCNRVDLGARGISYDTSLLHVYLADMQAIFDVRSGCEEIEQEIREEWNYASRCVEASDCVDTCFGTTQSRHYPDRRMFDLLFEHVQCDNPVPAAQLREVRVYCEVRPSVDPAHLACVAGQCVFSRAYYEE
jgi:hypothetical protein